MTNNFFNHDTKLIEIGLYYKLQSVQILQNAIFYIK